MSVPTRWQRDYVLTLLTSLHSMYTKLIDVITWIMGVETFKRQTRAVCGCLVADESPWARA